MHLSLGKPLFFAICSGGLGIMNGSLFLDEILTSESWLRKKNPKPRLFDPEVFGWGGGLPREWVGAKKFGMSFETQGKQTFWRDIPKFLLGGYHGGAPKV